MTSTTQQTNHVIQRDQQTLPELTAEERRLVEEIDRRAAKRRRLRQVLNYVPIIMGY